MILIWHHQVFSLSRTQSSNLFKGAWPHVKVPRWREEKGPQVNQGNTLNSDVGDLQGARHTEVKSRHGVSGHRILTHVDRARPTRCLNPASGAAWVLVRTPGPWWLGPKGGNEWVPRNFSRPREVLLSCPLVLSDTVFTAVTIMLNTVHWFRQAPFFVFPLRCWENTPGVRLQDKGQVWSLLSRDSQWEGDHIATSPATHWFFAWSLYPGVN